YRQLALLLESGINIVSALELLQDQSANRTLRKVLGEVVSDLRAGRQLSMAFARHPEVFTSICQRTLRVGEQTGNMEVILKQIADYLERENTNTKDLKNALRLPAITFVVAVAVIILMASFALPAFNDLYASLGAELPAITRIFLEVTAQIKSYGAYILLASLVSVLAGYAYIRKPEGKQRWDGLMLRLPLLGRLIHFNELARCARSMSLLYSSGVSLTEIIPMIIKSSGNAVMARALVEVHKDMLKGEGLSQPMSKNKLFLPLMVQMVKVGEETGNLDASLLSVARSYEAEVEDKTRSLISMIQPAMTLAIGLIIGLMALSLTSAMYSIYSQGMG
ncbi:MAG: type II secretion system F family protein, partial [Chloroflexi bacterium]|nr:type II secretion system F family protein [Chloroflexota bacterium]